MEEARRRRALRDAEMDQLEEEEAAMMGETKEEKQTELEKGSVGDSESFFQTSEENCN